MRTVALLTDYGELCSKYIEPFRCAGLALWEETKCNMSVAGPNAPGGWPDMGPITESAASTIVARPCIGVFGAPPQKVIAAP